MALLFAFKLLRKLFFVARLLRGQKNNVREINFFESVTQRLLFWKITIFNLDIALDLKLDGKATIYKHYEILYRENGV